MEEEKATEGHLIPDEIKYFIVLQKKAGDKSNKQIAKQVLSDYKRSIGNSTIENIWEKYQETGQIYNEWSHKGRPKLLNEEEQDLLIQTARDNRLSSSSELKQMLNLTVSRETVNRELVKHGYLAYKAPAKPLLSDDNIRERYQFALKHQSWNVARWRSIVFTDECPFRLANPNGRVFIRRQAEEELEPDTIQHLPSSKTIVMVWGAISCEGVGPLVQAKEKIKAKVYLNMFRYRLWRYYPGLYDGSQLYQDDNAGPHVAHIIDEWFNKNGIQRFDWPAVSPDLSLIEDVWNKIKFEMRGKVFKNKEELWKEINFQWHQVSPEFIDGLYVGLPNRIQAVLEAKGRETKY